MKNYIFIAIVALAFFSCSEKKQQKGELSNKIEKPFVWENANIYFLLTDRKSVV